MTRILLKHGCRIWRFPLPQFRWGEGSDFFEANASVVFSQPNMGLGLAFRDVKPYFSSVLQRWLTRAMNNALEAIQPPKALRRKSRMITGPRIGHGW
jgi:hypothetical protein